MYAHCRLPYDRTRLIKGAIHTLTEVMWHEHDDRLDRHPADPDASLLRQRCRDLHQLVSGGAVLFLLMWVLGATQDY